jgi:hypothetical protein
MVVFPITVSYFLFINTGKQYCFFWGLAKSTVSLKNRLLVINFICLFDSEVKMFKSYRVPVPLQNVPVF